MFEKDNNDKPLVKLRKDRGGQGGAGQTDRGGNETEQGGKDRKGRKIQVPRSEIKGDY